MSLLSSTFWQRIRRRAQVIISGGGSGGSGGGSGEYDTDSNTFFAVNTGLTTPQKDAVNNLVLAMKSAGIWSRLYAIYPFVGGTADAHKWNLKDPRDLDMAKRLTWVGGWVHGSTGITPNGSNAYAKTWIDPHEDNPQYSFSGFVYSRTNTAPTSDHVLFGGRAAADPIWLDIFSSSGAKIDAVVGDNSKRITFSHAYFTGVLGISCYHSNVFNVYQNGSSIASQTGSRMKYFDNNNPTNENGELFLGAYNNNETAQYFSYQELSFACFGWGLNSTQVAALNTAITNFQTALSRNV